MSVEEGEVEEGTKVRGGRGRGQGNSSCSSDDPGHSVGSGRAAVGSAGIGHPLLLRLPAGVPPHLVGGAKRVWLGRYLYPLGTVESESVCPTPRTPEGVPEV